MSEFEDQFQELYAVACEELELRLVHVGFSAIVREGRDTYFEHETGVTVTCRPVGFVIRFPMSRGEQHVTMPWGTPVDAVVRVAAGLAGSRDIEVFIRRFDCFDRINGWAEGLFRQATGSMPDGPVFDGDCEAITVAGVTLRPGEPVAAIWTDEGVTFRPAIP